MEVVNHLQENPERAGEIVSDEYRNRLNDFRSREGSAYVEPGEDVALPVVNAVGEVYDSLNREQKNEALASVLSNFDRVKYNVAQRYVSGIDEPMLVADISIARDWYWSGLDFVDGLILTDFAESGSGNDPYIGKRENFEELTEELLEDGIVDARGQSNFLTTYALLRSDRSDFGEEFSQKLDKEYLEDVMRGIVALRFGLFSYDPWGDRRERGLTDEELEEGRRRLEDLLPSPLHDDIDSLRQDTDWIDSSEF